MQAKKETLNFLIQEFEKKLKQAKFESSNKEYVVTEYYGELRRKIQIKKESTNLEKEMDEKMLNEIEGLIDLIDPFEKKTLNTFVKNSNNNNFNLKFYEMEKSFQNLIQKEADSDQVINHQISKLRDLLSKLAFLRNDLKSFLFNGTQLRFKDTLPDNTYNNFDFSDEDFISFNKKKYDLSLNDMNVNGFGKLFMADLNHFFGNEFQIDNIGSIFDISNGVGCDFETRCLKYECSGINFLENGDLYMHGGHVGHGCHEDDEEPILELELRIIEIKKMKIKHEKKIDVKYNQSSSTTSSNKICIQCNDLDGSQAILVLDDSLNTMCQIKEKNKKIIGSNQEFIFLSFKDFKIFEKNSPVYIYNWSLDFLNEIGQSNNPHQPFYFPIQLETEMDDNDEILQIFNDNRKLVAKYDCYYYLTTVDKINEFRIMDQKTGKEKKTYKHVNDFLLDLNNNLIIIGMNRSVNYFNLSFQAIKCIELKLNFRNKTINWFLSKNNNLHCYTQEKIDVGLDCNPTVYILHSSSNTTDF